MPDMHETYSEEETRDLGRDFARTLPATVLIAFSGDLGSGKTAFIRGMCEEFGCGEQVSSPTFTIVNEYSGTRQVRHCDLYRLDSIEEMLQIGLDAQFASEATLLVEWAERALPLLPIPRYEVSSRHGGSENHRVFSVQRIETAEEASILAPPVQMFRRKT